MTEKKAEIRETVMRLLPFETNNALVNALVDDVYNAAIILHSNAIVSEDPSCLGTGVCAVIGGCNRQLTCAAIITRSSCFTTRACVKCEQKFAVGIDDFGFFVCKRCRPESMR